MIVRVGVREDISRGLPQAGQKRLSSGTPREQEEQRRIDRDGTTLPPNKKEDAQETRRIVIEGQWDPWQRIRPVRLKPNRRIAFNRGTLRAFLEVTNLYGRDNVCCAREFRYVPQPDGSLRIERQDGFWLRRLPVLGLTWEFRP